MASRKPSPGRGTPKSRFLGIKVGCEIRLISYVESPTTSFPLITQAQGLRTINNCIPESAQRRPGPRACTRLQRVGRCPSFACRTLRVSASLRFAPQAPHPPHSSPSPTRPTLDSVIPLLKLERPSCLQPPPRTAAASSSLVCFSRHNPLPIKPSKFPTGKASLCQKQIKSQQELLKVLSKMQVPVWVSCCHSSLLTVVTGPWLSVTPTPSESMGQV